MSSIFSIEKIINSSRDDKITYLLLFIFFSFVSSILSSAVYTYTVDYNWFIDDSFGSISQEKREAIINFFDKKIMFVSFSIKRELSFILMFLVIVLSTKMTIWKFTIPNCALVSSRSLLLTFMYPIEYFISSILYDGSESKFLQNNIFSIENYVNLFEDHAFSRVFYELDLSTVIIFLVHARAIYFLRRSVIFSIMSSLIALCLFFSIKVLSYTV